MAHADATLSPASSARFPRFHPLRYMQLTLVLPGLIDLSSSRLAECDTHGTALAQMLATAPATPIEYDDESALLCTVLGVSRQADWPIAALLAKDAGIDPGPRYWLCAYPAALEVGRSDVRLAALIDDVSADEAVALLSMLNVHFSDDGLQFFAPEPSRWLLACPSTQRLVTKPPSAALGVPLLEQLPTGADAPLWRRWQNEIQMLLFEHPVNLAREKQGRLSINSLWLHGGGTFAAPASSNETTSVFADKGWMRGIARGAGADAASLPDSLSSILRSIQSQKNASRVLLWLHDIAEPGSAQQLAAIDRDWVAPLAAGIAQSMFSSTRVVITGRRRAFSFVLQKPSLATRVRGHFASRRLSTVIAPLRED